MGSTMWCRNCSKSKNHVGLGGNFWNHQETGDLVYRCTWCGHLRTRDIVELEEGTVIQQKRTEKTKTLARDGFLDLKKAVEEADS